MEKAIPGLISAIPDLVRDWELQTTVSDTCSIETSYVSDPSQGIWRERVEEQWENKRELGSGTFGVVSLQKCVSGPRNGSVRAVKRIQMRSGLSVAEVNVLSRELSAIVKFSHEQYRDCFVRSFGWFYANNALFITMEYFPFGDLQAYIENPLPETEARRICRQILQGLVFMHRNSFAHRDLKPSNILVQHKGPNWWVKLSDFGTSKQIGTTLLRTETGTRPYLAPEVQNIFSPSDLSLIESGAYSIAVDIWSVGVIIFHITMGRLPFEATTSLYRYVLLGESLPKTDSLTSECRDLMTSMMKGSPKQRPTAAEALTSSWINMASPVAEAEFRALIPHESSIYSNQWSTMDHTSRNERLVIETPTPAPAQSAPPHQSLRASFWDEDSTIKIPQNSPEKVLTHTVGETRIWSQFKKVQQLGKKNFFDERVSSVALSPDGKRLAVATWRHSKYHVYVWRYVHPLDFRDAQKLDSPGRDSEVFFTSDSKSLIVTSSGVPTSWQTDSKGVFQLIGTHRYIRDKLETGHGVKKTYISGTYFASNCELFVLRTRNDETKTCAASVWKGTPDGHFEEVQRRIIHGNEFASFYCSPDGQTYVEMPCNGRRSPIRLWRLHNDGLFHQVLETELPVPITYGHNACTATFSPNARWAVFWAVDWDKPYNVRTPLLEIERDRMIDKGFSLGSQWPRSAAFSPDSQFLATLLQNGDITIWRLKHERLEHEDDWIQEQKLKGEKGASLNNDSCSLAFSSDNKSLFIVTLNSRLQIWGR